MNRKKKILFATQLPPPVHGVSLIGSYLSQSVNLRESFNAKFINISFTRTIKDISSFSFRKLFLSLFTALELLAHLLWFRPNLVYYTIAPSGPALLRDIAYLMIVRVMRTRYVLHIHGQGFSKIAKGTLLFNLAQFIFKDSFVICLGNRLTEDVKLFFAGKPFILNNGIKDEFLSKRKTDKLQILFLSNFIKSKGILDALECVKQLHNDGIDFNFRLVGSEFDVSNSDIERFSQENNLSKKVEVLGPLFGSAKNKILESTDIMLFPSLNDAFPLVILEGMQFGIVVIATRQGSIPEMVEDLSTGFLVDENRPDQIAEKVKLLASQPRTLEQLSLQSRVRFKDKFEYQVFEKKLIDILTHCLNA